MRRVFRCDRGVDGPGRTGPALSRMDAPRRGHDAPAPAVRFTDPGRHRGAAAGPVRESGGAGLRRRVSRAATGPAAPRAVGANRGGGRGGGRCEPGRGRSGAGVGPARRTSAPDEGGWAVLDGGGLPVKVPPSERSVLSDPALDSLRPVAVRGQPVCPLCGWSPGPWAIWPGGLPALRRLQRPGDPSGAGPAILPPRPCPPGSLRAPARVVIVLRAGRAVRWVCARCAGEWPGGALRDGGPVPDGLPIVPRGFASPSRHL